MVIRLRQNDRERDTQTTLAPHQGIGLTGSPRTPSYSWDNRSAAMGVFDRGNAGTGADIDSKIAYNERPKGGDEDIGDEISAAGTEMDSEGDGEVTSQGSLTSID